MNQANQQQVCTCGSGKAVDRESVIVGKFDSCEDCAPDWDAMERDPECLAKGRGPGYDAERFAAPMSAAIQYADQQAINECIDAFAGALAPKEPTPPRGYSEYWIFSDTEDGMAVWAKRAYQPVEADVGIMEAGFFVDGVLGTDGKPLELTEDQEQELLELVNE